MGSPVCIGPIPEVFRVAGNNLRADGIFCVKAGAAA